jgi:hypothetical protein
MAQDDDNFVYAQEDLDAYQMSLEWLDFCTAQPNASVTFAKCIATNNLLPAWVVG